MMIKKSLSVFIASGFTLLIFFAGIGSFTKFDRVVMKMESVYKEKSDSARELRDTLYKIKGKYTLSGQHEYLEIPGFYSDIVYKLTGDYPALQGYEMGGIMKQTEEELAAHRDQVIEHAISWSKSGGIVAMTYHMNQPDGCYCWDTINNGGIPEEKFNEIVTPGTELYKKHIEDLDQTAEYLKRLRDADVPVLWRPYHEMNGRWFWWGEQPKFVELWKIMYDRFTKVHKLNNLLWVWSAATLEWAEDFEWYDVGPRMADVLAIDIYKNQYEQEYHDRLVALANGRPIAIGENGELPSVQVLANDQSEYVWFMAWADFLEKNNSSDVIKALYADERILTRDEWIRIKEGV